MSRRYRIDTAHLGKAFEVDADAFETRNGWIIFVLADRPGGTEVARFREWHVISVTPQAVTA